LCFDYCKFTKNTVVVSETPLIECIPNFSEGRNKECINSIVRAMDAIPNAAILHVDRGFDANRTVVTVAGSPGSVFKAVEVGIKKAAKLIDMRHQVGEHPRLGAVDVCPFVALKGISKSDLIHRVDVFAQKLAHETGLSIYLYADSAQHAHRSSLAAIRKGEYEGLRDKMGKPQGRPDLGSHTFNPNFGAMVMGVRDTMIAYNVHLDTEDVTIAKQIAGDLRTSGRYIRHGAERVHKAGRFPSLKAMGWWMPSYGWAQVSMNVMNYQTSPLHEVYEATKKRAEHYGVAVQGSELIGLAPLSALFAAGTYYAARRGLIGQRAEQEWIPYAVEGLGLDRLEPIHLPDRIIENCWEKRRSSF
jgi:glutamate formiminotransferase/formiminotetrahydrofolate cyclodeaminase